MISSLGLRIALVFRRLVPDPFVIAVLLTVVTAVLAVGAGFPEGGGGRRWGSERGF